MMMTEKRRMMIEGDVVVVVVVVENKLILYQRSKINRSTFQTFQRFTIFTFGQQSCVEFTKEKHTRHIHTYTYDDENKDS